MLTSAPDLSVAVDAPAVASDPERLNLLRTYVSADAGRQTAFNGIASVARALCGTAMAFVSIVDADHQWFLGADGSDLPNLPLHNSICPFALGTPGLLEVADTTKDARFAGMDLVVNHGVRFYAGIALRTPEGASLGALCVLDTQPRKLTASQRRGLAELSEQVMAQLELRRSLKQCERALFAHRRIMAVAGQDLGNPLMRAEVVLYGLERRAAGDDEARQDITTAREAVNEATATLRRLAHASLLDQHPIDVAQVSVAGLFATVEDRWRHTLAKVSRSLVLRPIDAVITSNGVLLSNILDNLISNALKHGKQGAITVEAGSAKHGVWIAVADEGPGLPQDERMRIFDALVQVGVNRAGLGLGLSIVQRTAELLGAHVSVQSEPGQGTRFLVELPGRHRDVASGRE